MSITNRATAGASLPHALTSVIDENGLRFAIISYDSQGRAIATRHTDFYFDYVSLSYGGNATTITDGLGAVRTSNFQTVLGVAKTTGQSQPGGSGCNALLPQLRMMPMATLPRRLISMGI